LKLIKLIELKLSLNRILKMKILLFFTKNLIYLLLHLNENNITDIEVIKLNIYICRNLINISL